MARKANDKETDEALMARVQNGDHGAFSALVERNSKMFYSAAYRITAHQNDAEDVVQDAFLKLWQRPDLWNASRGAKFTTWFYRIVTNQAIDHMRKKRPASDSEMIERTADKAPSQFEELEKKQQEDILETAIANLPERQRTALNLCFYEGVSNKDAAEIMGVGVKGMESLLQRAKASIKEQLFRQNILTEKGHAQ